MRSAAPVPDVRLTYDDFLLFPDDGKRHELIDGVHYVTPSPRLRHQDLVGRLHFEFLLYLREHPEAGRVFMAPVDVVMSFHDIVVPDLVFIAGDQTGIMTEANIQGAPALVVEVLSKRTRKRDVQIKRRLFEQMGVREYWLVDPETRTVEILVLDRDALHGHAVRTGGDMVGSPLLPEAAFAADDVFAWLDEIEEPAAPAGA